MSSVGDPVRELLGKGREARTGGLNPASTASLMAGAVWRGVVGAGM